MPSKCTMCIGFEEAMIVTIYGKKAKGRACILE